jgi:protein-S-isoprenylcysteine O-methyltransferase Ste14
MYRILMRVLKLLTWIVLNVGIFGLMLFVPAGTLDWWRAWVFIAVVFVAAVAIAVNVLAHSEGLLDERLKSPLQKGQPPADKVILILCLAAWGGLIVFIPLDVFRLHLLPTPGLLASLLGLGMVVVGWWVMYLAFRENAFAASVVRHQKERQQVVVSSGVYGFVRHPMYAGGVLGWIGVSMWLGSYTAALLTIVPIGTIALRILVEEQFLRRELQGYDAYSEKVRYRLIPFLW